MGFAWLSVRLHVLPSIAYPYNVSIMSSLYNITVPTAAPLQRWRGHFKLMLPIVSSLTSEVVFTQFSTYLILKHFFCNFPKIPRGHELLASCVCNKIHRALQMLKNQRASSAESCPGHISQAGMEAACPRCAPD